MTIYEVIAEPNRRQILDLLLQRPHAVSEMVEQLNISQPGVSKHLRVLRRAGLVRTRREAQRRWYELDPGPLQEVDSWLAGYRRVWEERYDNLDEYLKNLSERELKNERK